MKTADITEKRMSGKLSGAGGNRHGSPIIPLSTLCYQD